jgi:hypothetical protein
MEPNLSKSDFLNEDGHGRKDERIASAEKDLARAHSVYRDVLKTLTDSCKRHSVHLNKREFEIAMEGVGESLADAADWALRELSELGIHRSYTPDNEHKLIEAAYQELIESLRPAPINWMQELTDIVRPVTTNPATTEQVKVIEADLSQVMGRK